MVGLASSRRCWFEMAVEYAAMAERKDFWHEVRVAVTKDLVVEVIKWLVLGLPVVLVVVGATVKPVRDWLSADAHIMRGAVAALILVLVVAIAWLVITLGRVPARVPTSAPTPESPRATVSRLSDDGGMVAYFTGLRSLSDRFAEREEYLRKSVGRPIKWRGIVTSVKPYMNRVGLFIGPDDRFMVQAVFSSLFRERLLALHKGDIVQIEGKLSVNFDTPQVDGEAFSLMTLIDGAWSVTPESAEVPQVSSQEVSQAAPQIAPSPQEALPAPVKFDPDNFDLTPPRCRALIVLLHRVDQRTSLSALRQLVVTDGKYAEHRPTNKAQILQDMEDAEQAGIVSIERVDKLTQFFSLTTEGRRWALSKQAVLQVQALTGTYRRDAHE